MVIAVGSLTAKVNNGGGWKRNYNVNVQTSNAAMKSVTWIYKSYTLYSIFLVIAHFFALLREVATPYRHTEALQ